MVVHPCNPSYTGSVGGKIIVLKLTQAKTQTLSEKQVKQKGLVEWLKW
jgi:hypothetical protein